MVKIHSATRLKINKKKLEKEIEAILVHKEISQYLVNVVFVGKRKMLEIANTYKHENVALPVLSFTYKDTSKDIARNVPTEINDVDSENLLGEIFICYPQAVLLAAEREKSVDTTLIQLVDHGIDNLLK